MAWDEGHKEPRWFKKVLHTSRRGACEFLIVVAVFVTADPTIRSLITGALCSLLGQFLRIWAAGYGYKYGDLTLQGPYRFVRHPYFLGSAFFYLGLCIAGRHPWVTLGAMILMVLVYRSYVQSDEARLKKNLGPYFDRYKLNVAPFTPQLVPLEPQEASSRDFSLEYAVFRGRHRELDAIIGLLLAYGLLYLCQWLTLQELFRGVFLVAAATFVVGRILYYRFIRLSPA